MLQRRKEEFILRHFVNSPCRPQMATSQGRTGRGIFSFLSDFLSFKYSLVSAPLHFLYRHLPGMRAASPMGADTLRLVSGARRCGAL